MGTDNVKISPSQLQGHAQTAQTGASNTKNLSNDMGTAISNLVTSMNSVPILSNTSSALETFSTGLMATLECFALGMSVINQGLAIAATDFKSLDSSLASTFEALEGQITYYTGYGTTFVMPTVTTSTFKFAAVTASFSAPKPHHSFWGGVGNFFSHHWKPIVAGTLIVAGAVLTPVTAGGSDVIADSGAAALLADTAATATESGTLTQAMFDLAA